MSKIKIKICNGIPYVWDAKDWLKLRKEYRILGSFDGAEGTGRTNHLHVHLPVQLITVEMQYLIAQGLAEAVHAPSLEDPVVSVDQTRVDNILQTRKSKQIEKYKSKRKLQIESLVDKIVEGKRKKLKPGGILPDRQTILQNMLDKVKDPPAEVVQIDIKDPWLEENDYIPFNFPLPSTQIEKLKYRVFEDFHLRRKYWLTSGAKFGGDFLAYPGDPNIYHAEFIIVCQDNTRKIQKFHVTSLCRLAQIVKKTILIAIMDQETDKLKYWLPTQSKTVKSNNDEMNDSLCQQFPASELLTFEQD